MKKTIIFSAVIIAANTQVQASLAPDANLSIEASSAFTMDVGFLLVNPVLGLNGINLGTAQPASGSHSGQQDGSENPDIDQPWFFYANIGMHQSNTPITVLSDDGAGNVTLDFSGWGATWNTIPNINFGTGQTSGVASMTCAADCSNGDTYILNYSATVPLDDPSGFGGVNYWFDSVGTITEVVASPLPTGNVLSIATGNADTTDSTAAGVCTTGSCFGMDVDGIWYWSNIAAGTDGGLVIGKNQASGGQEIGDSFTNSTPGEVTDAWSFFGAFGTFFTPMGVDNIYHDQSCVDAACDGKTFIPSFDVAWNGSVIPMGDADPVNHPSGFCFEAGLRSINWQVNTDNSYVLDYVNDVPQQCGIFSNQVMRIVLRGGIQPGIFTPPTAGPVHIENISGVTSEWIPDVTAAEGFSKECAIVRQPANGMAMVDTACTFGTYQSNTGYNGIDDFEYSVTSGYVTATATVSVNVSASACAAYPVQMVTTTGGGQSQNVNGQLTTTFTGRLTTEQGLTSGAKNKVTICPGSKIAFEAASSIGAAVCAINGAVVDSSGTLSVGDKLICSNKPDGNDIDRFSVRSGL